MKKTKAVVWLLTLVTLLAGVLQTPISAKKDAEPMYYGREALSALENAEAYLFAYDMIVSGVEKSAAEITVFDGRNALSKDELHMVFDAYLRDHVEHFWIGSTYNYTYNSESVQTVKPSYIMSGEELELAKVAFVEAADAILSQIDTSDGEYERELAIHDILAAKVSYVKGAPNAHNAYGAIVQGKAVCEGYAEALQYLLLRAGIRSFIMLGESKDPSSGGVVGHAWNAVRIDGSYYHVDLTWNDQGESLYHSYFNLSDSQIREDHTIDDSRYPLPVCDKYDAHYFSVNSEFVFAVPYSERRIAELLENNGMTANLYIPDDKDAFIAWLGENISNIADELSISGRFSYGYSSIGREVFVYLNVCEHTSLSRVAPKKAGCTENGNIEYYVCECGKWFADSGASTMITNKSSVDIISSGHEWTVKTEDAEHLRANAADCSEFDTYWYECSKCEKISAKHYFEGDTAGAHVADVSSGYLYDKSCHWHPCAGCEDARFDESFHDEGDVCSVCGYAKSAQGGKVLDDFIPDIFDTPVTFAVIGALGGIVFLAVVIGIIKSRRR